MIITLANNALNMFKSDWDSVSVEIPLLPVNLIYRLLTYVVLIPRFKHSSE